MLKELGLRNVEVFVVCLGLLLAYTPVILSSGRREPNSLMKEYAFNYIGVPLIWFNVDS